MRKAYEATAQKHVTAGMVWHELGQVGFTGASGDLNLGDSQAKEADTRVIAVVTRPGGGTPAMVDYGGKLVSDSNVKCPA